MDIGGLEKVVDWVIVPLTAFTGWLFKKFKDLDDKQENIENSLSSLHIEMVRDYPTRREMREDFNELKDILNRIDAKLDRKADK